jgi:hypothetical protein
VKNTPQNARASCSDPNVPGNAGQYFSVLNCASLYGLSLLTFGSSPRLYPSRLCLKWKSLQKSSFASVTSKAHFTDLFKRHAVSLPWTGSDAIVDCWYKSQPVLVATSGLRCQVSRHLSTAANLRSYRYSERKFGTVGRSGLPTLGT